MEGRVYRGVKFNGSMGKTESGSYNVGGTACAIAKPWGAAEPWRQGFRAKCICEADLRRATAWAIPTGVYAGATAREGKRGEGL